MDDRTRRTASEQGYFGLIDIDDDVVEEVMSQCPMVFRRLGE